MSPIVGLPWVALPDPPCPEVIDSSALCCPGVPSVWLQNWLQWPENGRIDLKLVTFLVTVEVGSFRNRLHKLACLIWPL